MYEDDDIFSSDDNDVFQTSESSGTTAPTSRGVPGYLRDALNRYIQENPSLGNSYTQYREDNELFTFIRLYTIMSSPLSPALDLPEPTGSLGRTVFEFLNDSTEGLLQRRYEAYNYELTLMRLHGNASFIGEVYEKILATEVELSSPSKLFMQYLRSLHDATWHSLRYTADEYRRSCELADMMPDEQVIEFGIKSEADFGFAMGEHTTQILGHYKFGNISKIAQAQEESTRRLFLKYFVPLVTRSPEEIMKLLEENAAI